jgi:hypothetical protein
LAGKLIITTPVFANDTGQWPLSPGVQTEFSVANRSIFRASLYIEGRAFFWYIPPEV